MPTLSSFFGIVIYMYFFDHLPPHFHAKYGDDEVLVNINKAEVFEGYLPRPQLAHVISWCVVNQAALLRAWEACSKGKTPAKIPPLAIGKKRRKSKKGKK
jgi:hypothetical protein